MRYLTKVVETYRLANEKEVEDFLKELKEDDRFQIVKYSSVKKERREKKEIVDEWIRFEVTKLFNEERNPDREVAIEYNYE